MSSRSDRFYIALLSVLLLVSYSYFFQGGKDNGIARLAQTEALASHGALNIDKHAYRSADVIKFNDRYYPNKAPGLSFLAVPAWIVAKALSPLLTTSPEKAEHLAAYLTVIFSVGVTSIFLCVCIFTVARALALSGSQSFFLAAFFGIGSIAFPFSTMLFSHQTASMFCFLAFTLLYLLRADLAQESIAADLANWLATSPVKVYFVAGLVLGYSLCLEYPTAISVGIIGLYSLYLAKDRFEIYAVFCGGFLGLAPLLIYNYIIAGSIFFIPYAEYATAEASMFPGHKIGILGVTIPPLHNFLEILFKPQRGLFFVNSWFLVALLGLPFTSFWKSNKSTFVVSSLIVLCFIIFNAGYGHNITYWGGGASTGPRHIIPALPFLAILIAPVLKNRWMMPFIFISALISSACVLLATAVEPRLPYDYFNPVKEFLWIAYLYGDLSQNPHGFFNSVPIFDGTVAFSLGTALGFSRYTALVPLLIFWAGVLLLAFRSFYQRLIILVFYSTLAIAPYYHHSTTHPNLGQGEGFVGKFIREVPWKELPYEYSELKVNPDAVALVRVDERISFEWGTDSAPIYGAFSVIWTGNVQVHEEGLYRFSIRSDDGSALYLNGKLLINHWSDHGASTKEATVELSQGSHKLALLYYNSLFNGEISIRWAKDGEALEFLRPPFITYDESSSEENRSLYKEN